MLSTRLLALASRTPTGCLEWTGSRSPQGYGRIRIGGRNGKVAPAHRVAWETWVGPIPDGLVIDHTCRNRACIEPTHLRTVSASENTMADNSESTAKINASKESCPSGHAYSGYNLIVYRGRRYCRTCMARYSEAARQRRKAKRRL